MNRNTKVCQSNNEMSLYNDSRLCSLRSASDKTQRMGESPETFFTEDNPLFVHPAGFYWTVVFTVNN